MFGGRELRFGFLPGGCCGRVMEQRLGVSKGEHLGIFGLSPVEDKLLLVRHPTIIKPGRADRTHLPLGTSSNRQHGRFRVQIKALSSGLAPSCVRGTKFAKGRG